MKKGDESRGDGLRIPNRGFRLTTCANDEKEHQQDRPRSCAQDTSFDPTQDMPFDQAQDRLVQRPVTWLVVDLWGPEVVSPLQWTVQLLFAPIPVLPESSASPDQSRSARLPWLRGKFGGCSPTLLPGIEGRRLPEQPGAWRLWPALRHVAPEHARRPFYSRWPPAVFRFGSSQPKEEPADTAPLVGALNSRHAVPWSPVQTAPDRQEPVPCRQRVEEPVEPFRD